MLDTLVLDSLLILILLLLIPLGLYRGGLREVCSAAGLLLGLHVAQQWSSSWGDWIANVTGIDDGVSRFIVAVGTMVLFTAAIGYGAAASFSYTPGPGGRLFGGLISLFAGVIFLGALIQFVAAYLYDGVYPDLIREGYVSRSLSIGFEWVLLIVAGLALLAALFGMVVREREFEEAMVEVPAATNVARRSSVMPAMAPEPTNLEPSESPVSEPVTVANTSTVKIREVRHWEEPTPPTMQDLQSGWSRTWPSSVTSDMPKAKRSSGDIRTPRSPQAPRKPAGSPDEAVIRDWLSEDQQGRSTERTRIRRDADE